MANNRTSAPHCATLTPPTRSGRAHRLWPRHLILLSPRPPSPPGNGDAHEEPRGPPPQPLSPGELVQHRPWARLPPAPAPPRKLQAHLGMMTQRKPTTVKRMESRAYRKTATVNRRGAKMLDRHADTPCRWGAGEGLGRGPEGVMGGGGAAA